MSPRSSSSATPSSSGNSNSHRAAAAPYTRRPTGQPKSSRQQFSACGACRMRRVRCDLKDLPFSSAGPHPACSNCKERGLKCVDEFADVKAVKLLRRGRRLQQVEAIYGKVVDPESASSSSSLSPVPRLESRIPLLQPEFFTSPFWRWFSMQRPIIDPTEFPARFLAHAKSTHPLGHEGRLLAMVLVVWAASFGVDERGVPDKDDDGSVNPFSHEIIDIPLAPSSSSRRGSVNVPAEGDMARTMKNGEVVAEGRRKDRRDRTDAMVREVLELIDLHGVMRRPTWDGVRVLLLLLPFMEEANPLNRLTMYEATLSQVHALCSLTAASPGPSSSMHAYPADDTIVRACIFWYAHVQEGITTGLRGGRLVLDEDDLDALQSTLPPFGFGVGNSGVSSPTSSTFSSGPLPMFPPVPQLLIHRSHSHPHQRGSPAQSYLHTAHLFSLPMHLSAVCRKVHAVLTGPRATRRADDGAGIDSEGMREVWDGLDRCWEEFNTVRNGGMGVSEEGAVEVERFVSGWQIFIFECHNIIRESLKQFIMSRSPAVGSPTQPMFPSASPPSRPSSHSSTSSAYLSPHYLHTLATRKCLGLLPFVLSIIKRHLSTGERDGNGAGLFRWDAGLVRDGCFFAGFLVASGEGDAFDFSAEDREFKREGMDGVRGRMGAEEGVEVCLRALAEMRWAFSKSEEREETVRMAWEARKIRRHGQYHGHAPIQPQELDIDFHHQHNPYTDHHTHSPYPGKAMHHTNPQTDSHTILPLCGISNRSILPPLSLAHSPRHLIDSAPNTGYNTDGSGANGWPSYTPPGTGASATTSASTGMSGGGSPVFPNLLRPDLHGLKSDGSTDDTFYHVAGDVDQFSFSAPVAEPSTISNAVAYHHRNTPAHAHAVHDGAPSSYLDTGVAFTPTRSSAMHAGPDDINGCAQFGDGFYQ